MTRTIFRTKLMRHDAGARRKCFAKWAHPFLTSLKIGEWEGGGGMAGNGGGGDGGK